MRGSRGGQKVQYQIDGSLLGSFGEQGLYISCGLRDLHQILFLLVNVIYTKIVGSFLPEHLSGFRLL